MVAIEPRTFHASAGRARPMLVLGVLVMGAGLYLLTTTQPHIVGLAALAFGAVLAGFLGRPAWRRIRMIWLDEQGLSARLPGFGCVRWQDIEATWVDRVEGRVFLFVDRTAPARAAAPLGMVLRTLATMTKAPDLALPIDMLDVPPDQVAAAIEVARQQTAADRGKPAR